MGIANKIVSRGFESRQAHENSYYGAGAYFASRWCKAAQYMMKDGRRSGVIIVARVLLGHCYETGKVCREMKLPPERFGGERFDSVVANPGPMTGHHANRQVHQEFVIFNNSQAYPEYVLHPGAPILFKRLARAHAISSQV